MARRGGMLAVACGWRVDGVCSVRVGCEGRGISKSLNVFLWFCSRPYLDVRGVAELAGSDRPARGGEPLGDAVLRRVTRHR